MLEIIFYILSIVIANVITGVFQPISIYGFIIPVGTFFIGFTFIIRDFIQKKYGRNASYKCIFFSILLSAILSIWNGDIMFITMASLIAFAVSESFDTEIFTRINTSFKNRLLISGLVGGIFDSAIFVIIGLSPLTTGILSWDFVINGIIGQYVVKSVIQFIAYIFLAYYDNNFAN